VDDCKYKIPNLIFTPRRSALLAILAELLSFRIDAGLPENKNCKRRPQSSSAPTCSYPERIPFSMDELLLSAARSRGLKEGTETGIDYGIEGYKHRNI